MVRIMDCNDSLRVYNKIQMKNKHLWKRWSNHIYFCSCLNINIKHYSLQIHIIDTNSDDRRGCLQESLTRRHGQTSTIANWLKFMGFTNLGPPPQRVRAANSEANAVGYSRRLEQRFGSKYLMQGPSPLKFPFP